MYVKINSQERETFSAINKQRGKERKKRETVVTLIRSRGEKKKGLIESHGSYNESNQEK